MLIRLGDKHLSKSKKRYEKRIACKRRLLSDRVHGAEKGGRWTNLTAWKKATGY